jgi:hypothetical protein
MTGEVVIRCYSAYVEDRIRIVLTLLFRLLWSSYRLNGDSVMKRRKPMLSDLMAVVFPGGGLFNKRRRPLEETYTFLRLFSIQCNSNLKQWRTVW